ncbi:MAG: hypothetical protein ACRCX2_37870 [Paraclostridium sp.]
MDRFEIRTITDIFNNVYDIYEYQVKDCFGKWIGKTTFFSREEAEMFKRGCEFVRKAS